MTLTTVGYGDLGFDDNTRYGSRIFSIFFILASVLIASVAIGNISTVNAEARPAKGRPRGSALSCPLPRRFNESRGKPRCSSGWTSTC